MAEDKKVVLKELSSDGNWYKRLFESSSDIVQRDTKPGHTVEQDLTTIENTLLGKVSGTARIYKSIGEISSSLSISSTMVSICGAMAAGSIALYGNTSGNTTIYPTDNGTILILKYSNEYCMCFYNDVESNKVYTGVYYNSASISTAKWSGWSTYAMSNHTHTAATSSTLGMVKSGGDVTIDSSGIITVKDDSHNHTISNVDGLQTELSDLSAAIEAAVASITNHANNKSNPHGVTVTQIGAIPTSKIGAAGGVASLDSAGKVPSSQLPSYVDDVLEFTSVSKFPNPGESGKIYTDTTTNKTYRWSGSGYTEISPSIALGETSSTAYRGDRGKTAYDHSQTTSGNPHGVTKSDVGLGNVGNYKALSTVSGQGLSSTEVTNVLNNLGITATITEINYIDGVTSNIQTQLNGKAASSHGTHVTYSTTAPKAAGTASAGSAATVARSDHVHPAQTTVSGNAGTATKLATPRTIRTNLGSTSTASFDGSANITPGVTGTLGIGNGGTGATTAANARTNLGAAEGYSKTATFSASGWYRIATSASGISNNIGLFSIRAAVSGKHSNVILAAGISYGDYPDIVQILTSNFSSAAITKARIVYHTTYNNNYAYLELYINTNASTTVDVSMSLCEGWTLVSPNTAGSIPSGYTSKECVLANGTIGGYTASRALVTNSSGVITESAVTSTELGYLDGVTSSIQTQLNAKAASSHTHDIEDISSLSTTLSQKQNTITGAATTILTSNLTASRALVSNSSGKVTVSAVTATELGYLDGVTSSIQTQLNAKAASSHNHNGTYVRLVDQTSQPTNQSTGDLWLCPI